MRERGWACRLGGLISKLAALLVNGKRAMFVEMRKTVNLEGSLQFLSLNRLNAVCMVWLARSIFYFSILVGQDCKRRMFSLLFFVFHHSICLYHKIKDSLQFNIGIPWTVFVFNVFEHNLIVFLVTKWEILVDILELHFPCGSQYVHSISCKNSTEMIVFVDLKNCLYHKLLQN